MNVKIRGFCRSVVVVMSFLGIGSPAWAVDGVIEINQDSVIATGGFPYIISSPGSYRLTSNLDITGEPTPENLNVIEITSDNVTLDLNGFEIVGPTVCGGTPLGCNPSGFGRGVHTNGNSGIAVRNGTVRGMGGDGIVLVDSARVIDVHVTSNGGDGLNLLRHGHVERVTATLNLNDGINVFRGVKILDCVANLNGEDGIDADAASLLVGNNTWANEGDGIELSGSGSLVLGNTSVDNDALALRFVFGDSAYKDNVLQGSGGTVLGGIQIGTNLCGNNAICP